MIIGVGGEKKHGKDTVANYLVEQYGYKKMAFADKLKHLCSSAFNVPIEDCYDENKKETGYIIPVTLHAANKLLDSILVDYPMHPADMLSIFKKLGNKNMFSSIRDMLQFVGTDILRDMVDENYHYNSVARVFREENVVRGVVSDCRFANERLNLENQFNANTILVMRPSLEKNATSSHASETSLGSENDYHHVIINDGSLEDLYNNVDAFMQQLNINKSNPAQ
jgi:hypothetical protein